MHSHLGWISVSFAIGLAVSASACASASPDDGSDQASSQLAPGQPVPPPPSPYDGGVVQVDAAPPPSGGSCTQGGFGNANGVCTKDVDLLVTAESSCVSAGMLLKSFQPDESCGSGASSSVSYTCCGSTPPPPPPPTCTKGGMANANGACSSDSTMYASAQNACEASGLVLTSFVGDEKCGKGSSNSATYTCCAPQATPGTPPAP